jgi:hypothetical protein
MQSGISTILARFSPLSLGKINILDALNRVIGEDVYAPRNIPPDVCDWKARNTSSKTEISSLSFPISDTDLERRGVKFLNLSFLFEKNQHFEKP